MPNDVYLQPDAPDPVLTDAVVLGLVHRQVPNAHAVTSVDESGGEARSYWVDDDLILKTQRPHRLRPRTSLAKEAAFLDHLAAFPTIPVPRVLGYGHAEGVEYLCMTRMPGDAVIRQTITGPARSGVLHALGQVLRQIHAVPQAPLAASGRFPGDHTADDLRARLGETFDEVGVRDLAIHAHPPVSV
jgi:hygromycin-B 7''-O-kinase